MKSEPVRHPQNSPSLDEGFVENYAVAWTVALAAVAHAPGLHSTAGIWLEVFGLPGVADKRWVQTYLHNFNSCIDYSLLLLANWVFSSSIILGLVSLNSKF